MDEDIVSTLWKHKDDYWKRIIPLRYSIRELEKKYKYGSDIEAYRELLEKQAEIVNVVWEYIRKEEDLGFRLYLVEALKKFPYMYDQAYLDELSGLFASYENDYAPLNRFRQYLEDASRYVHGTLLRDAKVFMPNGEDASLLSQLNKNGYTVLDFWASYCGPCRASFPHLRKLYDKYNGEVKFIGLSSDYEQERWLKALKEEKLPWPQFFRDKELRLSLNVRYIPVYLLIDKNGRIVFWANTSGDLELQLEKLFN